MPAHRGLVPGTTGTTREARAEIERVVKAAKTRRQHQQEMSAREQAAEFRSEVRARLSKLESDVGDLRKLLGSAAFIAAGALATEVGRIVFRW